MSEKKPIAALWQTSDEDAAHVKLDVLLVLAVLLVEVALSLLGYIEKRAEHDLALNSEVNVRQRVLL